MRKFSLSILAATVCLTGLAATPAVSQQQQQDAEDVLRETADRQRRLNREFQRNQLPLPELDNSGPCPFVKVLYDAARNVEFVGDPSAANVAWSGEIQGVAASCSYSDTDPIVVDVITTFAVGRGPQGQGDERTFSYWIAVTHRDASILGKEQFAFTAEIPRGSDRTLVFDRVQQIVIPRATAQVSGINFEVLIGFDVTPEMAAFNRQGSRFLVNAGTGATATASAQ